MKAGVAIYLPVENGNDFIFLILIERQKNNKYTS